MTGAIVAALFVQPDGCYAGVDHIDVWTESRDARKYGGPYPVVAHPPCQLWTAFASLNYARYGGEHNKPGNDGGCFASALESVRRYGGVLEHPAKSKAWKAYRLEKPSGEGWSKTNDGGWVCEVWQSAYGHKANKATWLYYCGESAPFDLRWARIEGSHRVGWHGPKVRKTKPTLSKKEANATPSAFKDELIKLAIMANSKPI